MRITAMINNLLLNVKGLTDRVGEPSFCSIALKIGVKNLNLSKKLKISKTFKSGDYEHISENPRSKEMLDEWENIDVE
jgi:hypothetical protein